MSAISMVVAAQSGIEPRFQIPIGPFEMLRRFGARLGPYVLLELLLPGGTMFALLLLLYRRRKLNAGSLPPAVGVTTTRSVRAAVVIAREDGSVTL